jgi:phosphatidylglycerol:prolipoprotein diacylglycerol transferase
MDSFNVVFSVGGVALTWNAVMLALGILVAVVVSGIVVKKRGVYKDLALDACIVGIPLGLLGGRLFSAISGKIAFSAFFDLSQSGMNLPGALVLVGIGIAVYACIKKLSVPEVFDVLVPGAFLGLAVGRWSDFFLCEGLGPVVGEGVPKFFPLATFTQQYFLDGKTVAYAIFFLDFLVCAVLGIVALLSKKRTPGTVSRGVITGYLFAEFILEWLRDGSTRQILFGEVRFNQIVLLAMLLFFIGLSLYRAKHPAYVEDEQSESPEAPTDAPEEPTESPDEPTEAPDEPTESPEAPTESPDEPIEAFETPTEAQEEPTEMSDEPTDAPEPPTDAPEDGEGEPA